MRPIGMPSVLSSSLLARLTGPLPDDHPTYALIGRVASEWAHYESTLDIIIWKLADLSGPSGACITAQLMGAGNRLVTISSLANERGIIRTIGADFHALERRTYEPQEKRNRVIHDPWFLEQPTNVVKQKRSKPKKEPVFGFISIDEVSLTKLIEEIRELRKRALALYEEILKVL